VVHINKKAKPRQNGDCLCRDIATTGGQVGLDATEICSCYAMRLHISRSMKAKMHYADLTSCNVAN